MGKERREEAGRSGCVKIKGRTSNFSIPIFAIRARVFARAGVTRELIFSINFSSFQKIIDAKKLY
jgi:hypothetical protein